MVVQVKVADKNNRYYVVYYNNSNYEEFEEDIEEIINNAGNPQDNNWFDNLKNLIEDRIKSDTSYNKYPEIGRGDKLCIINPDGTYNIEDK